MAEILISARLQGDAVENNTVPLQMFTDFITNFQKTVTQVGLVLDADSGRDARTIRSETALRLATLEPGSFMPVMLPAIEGGEGSLAVRALLSLVKGLVVMREPEPHIPEGYDQGVLSQLYKVGQVFRKGIDAIEFRLVTPQIDRSVTYDYGAFIAVKRLIEEAEEEFVALEGRLLDVSFKERRSDDFKLYLYLADDSRIGCDFDEDLADEVQSALRHFVHVIGRAKLDNLTKKPVSIKIGELTVLDLPERPSEESLASAFERYREDHDTVAQFRKAWDEAMSGKTRPISQLWDDFDAE